jgi:hypothetical protein
MARKVITDASGNIKGYLEDEEEHGELSSNSAAADTRARNRLLSVFGVIFGTGAILAVGLGVVLGVLAVGAIAWVLRSIFQVEWIDEDIVTMVALLIAFPIYIAYSVGLIRDAKSARAARRQPLRTEEIQVKQIR